MVATPLFFTPKYALLVPKTPLFDGHFALLGHVFHGSLRVCLFNCGELLCVLCCVLHHFALHLAPFYLAFSTKSHCVLRHFTLRFVPKRSAFSGILHRIWLQMAQSVVQIAVLCNAYSFCLRLQLTPFCPKTNLRENRFFAARWAVGG